MKYQTLGKTGLKVSILGFGAMRLPLIDNNPEHIDIVKTELMIDYAIKEGVNLFDTAWIYHTTDRTKPGASESVLGNILNQGYREKINLSTKIPSWEINSWEYFDNVLNKQLDRLKTDSIDLYLIHSIKDSFYEEIKSNGLYEFIDKILSDGRIKHVGFSTHGSYNFLKEILDDYDKWEFALTQLNYLDENDNTGLKGVMKLNELNLGTIIMEPLRGGKLASNLPKEVQNIFNNSPRNYNPVEWGLNYLWDKKEINCVLSGMSSIDQVKENIKIANNSYSGMLNDSDKNILKEVKECYDKLNNIPCTECFYCMPCPSGVNIPKCFREYNMDMIGDSSIISRQYDFHLNFDRQAHNCTNCGYCNGICPQNINIPRNLKVVEKHFHRK
ncbi:MAG: aldo/keto reductase [Methanobacteriaceae archaeon]|nr:aldo/keto reductase [Methanobacteriaceae archaeon]